MEIKRRDRTLSNTGEDIRRRYELDKLDKLNIEELSKLTYPLPPELGGTGLSSLGELTDNIRNDMLSPLDLGTITTETDLNTALESIYNNYDSVSIINITWMDVWRWFGTMTKSSANTAFILAHSAQDNATIKIKYRTSGVWRDFLWVNPPMEVGVEYKTTEKFNGNPVYTKLISHTFSNGVSGVANYNVPHGLSGTFYIIDVETCTDGYVFPYVTSGGTTAITSYGASALVLTNDRASWGSQRTWYFKIKYTKG